jgi:hypothetical protein
MQTQIINELNEMKLSGMAKALARHDYYGPLGRRPQAN